MEAASPEKLLEAFQVLDPDAKGFVTRDYIGKLMMDEGEPFTQVSNFRSIKIHLKYLCSVYPGRTR